MATKDKVTMKPLTGLVVDKRTEEIFDKMLANGFTKAVVLQKMLIFCHCSKGFDIRTAAKEWEGKEQG